MNAPVIDIWTLDTTIGIQRTIRAAIVEHDEAACRWLDAHLAGQPRGYVLAALSIAYHLLHIMARTEAQHGR